MAIGTAWVDGAWVDAGWVTEAWSDVADTTPDAFSFTDLTDQALSTLLESSEITVAGIDAAAAVTFIEGGHTSGEYSRNSGAWTDLANFNIDNGDTLRLRLTSSGSNSTAFTIQVTIGGVSDTWSLTTLASGIRGGSPDVHAIRRRAWARINRRVGRVEQEDVDLILQTIEDDELIGIIQAFLQKVG